MSGRPPLTDDFLREVAHIYQENVKAGRPVKAVADHYGAPYQTASKWASRARIRGFLAPTSNGRASGEPERAKYRAIREDALAKATACIEESANLREAEGEIALAEYGRELAALIRPTTAGA